MIRYPYLQEQPSSRVTTDVFRGLNLGSRIGEGEFCEMENLTSDHFPVLSPRKQRGRIFPVIDPQGLYHVPGGATFFVDGRKLMMYSSANDTTKLISDEMIITQTPRQFALMGTRLVIVPDMKWLDIQYPFAGLKSMGAWLKKSEGEVTFSLCQQDGSSFGTISAAAEPLENPGNMALWMDISGDESELKQYSASAKEWVSISTYVKLSGLTDHPFQTGDGITICGINKEMAALNGSYVVETVGSDFLVIVGIIQEPYTHNCADAPLEIRRDVPNLDFILEAGNRLWGCKENVNEIYASKLGDCTNWNVFSGISTDSWVGNVGSPGSFTGAVNHGGYPVFYKENTKHKVWPSSNGAHQITSMPCMGIARGSSESIALCGEKLFYLSPQGICMDDGSGPVTIDGALGNRRYRNGAGAVCRSKYYLSAANEQGQYDLLVYDLSKGLWHREDQRQLMYMTPGNQELYALGSRLWDLTGRRGTAEEAVSWIAVTGDLCQSSGDHQYISRLTLRLALDEGSQLNIYARYDHNPLWVKLGTVYGTGPDSFSLPMRPRRCDHLQLKLEGQGPGKIYAMTRTFEKGSELP